MPPGKSGLIALWKPLTTGRQLLITKRWLEVLAALVALIGAILALLGWSRK
jgi:hypothetical protein